MHELKTKSGRPNILRKSEKRLKKRQCHVVDNRLGYLQQINKKELI